MKRGWGYENEDVGKLKSGLNAYGVWIAFKDRDPIRSAMVVCGALIAAAFVLAAAIAFGGTL